MKRFRILQPSTVAFWREGRRTPGYSFLDWLHGYVYCRWPYLYVGVALGEHPLSRLLWPLGALLSRLYSNGTDDDADRVTSADLYHGKVVPLEAARQLITVREDIELTNLEHIIPYARARDIILKNPDHIVVLECPCRASRPNPCLPLDVCLVIGEPFASFVAEHHPGRSRWITQQGAEEILRAEQGRGHVSHAFLKDAMFGRFYAICNCCSCCCGGMQAWSSGSEMLAPSGYLCRVDSALCIDCGVCVEYCQFRALALTNGSVAVSNDVCMGCGVCVAQCEQGALELVRDETKGEPLEIKRLIAESLAANEADHQRR
jgi:NAD-dependent dihydropyrimidine dehydrogenase PreA subunit